MTSTSNKSNKESKFLDGSEYWEDSSIIFQKNTKTNESYAILTAKRVNDRSRNIYASYCLLFQYTNLLILYINEH